MTDEAKTRWLQNQRTPSNGGRKAILKENDKERVWNLFKKYENKSLVAELLGVNQRTIRRYLKKYPMPNTFVVARAGDAILNKSHTIVPLRYACKCDRGGYL